jgi:outer membrane protein OmpA-like peptidoglycan-associated protein
MMVQAFIVAALLFQGPAAAQAQPVETEIAGVTAEVVELRQSGGVLRLAVRFTNGGTAQAESSRYSLERIVLVDVKSRKKHFPIKDANGHYLGGPMGDSIDGGRIALRIPARQATVVWAYFEPVAPGTVMTVEMPQVFPFDNVPVTEGAGSAGASSAGASSAGASSAGASKVFASATAATTPGGAIATLVSAKRADQVVNVRLRFSAERGQNVHLLSPYFMFWNVFLFDPVSKRKYPLIKDAEGIFQGQPLTVKMEGGGFIPDWAKTTLVSFTFQAPPDTVQRADLLMPQFLPFEAVAIEGLGGAADSGIAAAGTTLGLEGALKELKAEVTATAITIDLAADVLFDFDKASIKKEAEPSLQHLATVLKANPGAAVSIEGHTDAKGAEAYNQTLSEQRAASVKQWLVANAQVNGATIATRGWGKSKPLTHNTKPDGSDDPEGRAKNRRVQVVVRKGAVQRPPDTVTLEGLMEGLGRVR